MSIHCIHWTFLGVACERGGRGEREVGREGERGETGGESACCMGAKLQFCIAEPLKTRDFKRGGRESGGEGATATNPTIAALLHSRETALLEHTSLYDPFRPAQEASPLRRGRPHAARWTRRRGAAGVYEETCDCTGDV